MNWIYSSPKLLAMIADQIKGKDFYGLLAYHEKKVKEGKGYFLNSSITYGKTVEMTKEFNVIRQLRPGLSKAVYHVSLNLPYGDKIGDKEFILLGMDYLKGMGFDDNQYIMYRHIDQDHHHIHIIANRVKLSGSLVSDSKDYERSERLVRKLEKKYGLSQLPSKKLIKSVALSQKEIEKVLRTGQAPVKLIIRQHLETALSNSKDVAQFIGALRTKGISPKFNVSKSTGRVTGISFKYQNVIYKGSALGRQYSWNNILKIIDYEQDRDRSIILQNDNSERRVEGVTGQNIEPTRSIAGKTTNAPAGTIEAYRQPKNNLGNTQTGFVNDDYLDKDDWTSFKLELGRKWRKKRKKGRGKRL